MRLMLVVEGTLGGGGSGFCACVDGGSAWSAVFVEGVQWGALCIVWEMIEGEEVGVGRVVRGVSVVCWSQWFATHSEAWYMQGGHNHCWLGASAICDREVVHALDGTRHRWRWQQRHCMVV